MGGFDISSIVPLVANNDAITEQGSPNAFQQPIRQFQKFQSVTRPFISVLMDMKINKSIILQTGMEFIQKGFVAVDFWNIGDGLYNNLEYTLSYLEVPFIFFYGTSVGQGKAYFGAGPFFSYGFKGKVKSQYIINPLYLQYNPNSHDSSVTQSISYNRFIPGIDIALAYELKFGLTLNITYNLGLVNVMNGTDPFSGLITADSQNTKQLLSVFKFGIGFMFNHTGKAKTNNSR
jgi:hypothetical protein